MTATVNKYHHLQSCLSISHFLHRRVRIPVQGPGPLLYRAPLPYTGLHTLLYILKLLLFVMGGYLVYLPPLVIPTPPILPPLRVYQPPPDMEGAWDQSYLTPPRKDLGPEIDLPTPAPTNRQTSVKTSRNFVCGR